MIGDILQPTHLLFVLVVALLVLGPKRLPEVGRSLGRGLRDFRSALSGEESSNETIPPASVPPTEGAAATEPETPPAENAAPAAPEAPPPAAQPAQQSPPPVSTQPIP